MSKQRSYGKINASLLALAALVLVLALIVFKFKDGGPELHDILGNMAKKTKLLSGMQVNLLKSVETE